jgi:hypothetical protein
MSVPITYVQECHCEPATLRTQIVSFGQLQLPSNLISYIPFEYFLSSGMAELIAIIRKSTRGLTGRASDLLLKNVTLKQAPASWTEQRETAASSEGPHPSPEIHLRLISATTRRSHYGSHTLCYRSCQPGINTLRHSHSIMRLCLSTIFGVQSGRRDPMITAWKRGAFERMTADTSRKECVRAYSTGPLT